MTNINEGHSREIIRRSETLDGYSVFIAKAEEYEAAAAREGGERRLSDDEKKTAMKKVINWCIAKGVLKPFLESHGSEVVNMLMNEWNLEDALVVEREEGREESRAMAVNNLFAFGMTPEQISKALKLPFETVMQYRGSIQQ